MRARPSCEIWRPRHGRPRAAARLRRGHGAAEGGGHHQPGRGPWRRPQIGAMLKRLGVESQFVNGLRVTDRKPRRSPRWCWRDRSTRKSSADRRRRGRAVGISGKDAGLVIAEKVQGREADPLRGIERHVDLGFVGEPVAVDPRLIESLCADGIIPVIAPVAIGLDGHTYNINADTMAARSPRAGRVALLPADRCRGRAGQAGRADDRPEPGADRGLRSDGTISGG